MTSTIAFAITALYLVMSVTTFVVYAIDKRAAQRNDRRIRERTLHVLGLAGGWPGAMLAQSLLRHKSRKQPFRQRVWWSALANCAGMAVLMWLALRR